MSASAYSLDLGAILNSPLRIGVTELSRNTEKWKKQLKSSGILEVTDRSGTAAYLVSESSIKDLADTIDEQAKTIERLSMEAMFESRTDNGEWESGSELAKSAMSIFEKRFAR